LVIYFHDIPAADSKVNQKIINFIKNILPSTPFLGLTYEDSRVTVFANVPEEKWASIRADDWIKATLAQFGGRGGGKPGNAQGQAQGVDEEKVDHAVTVATDYAMDKMGVSVS